MISLITATCEAKRLNTVLVGYTVQQTYTATDNGEDDDKNAVKAIPAAQEKEKKNNKRISAWEIVDDKNNSGNRSQGNEADKADKADKANISALSESVGCGNNSSSSSSNNDSDTAIPSLTERVNEQSNRFQAPISRKHAMLRLRILRFAKSSLIMSFLWILILVIGLAVRDGTFVGQTVIFMVWRASELVWCVLMLVTFWPDEAHFESKNANLNLNPPVAGILFDRQAVKSDGTIESSVLMQLEKDVRIGLKAPERQVDSQGFLEVVQVVGRLSNCPVNTPIEGSPNGSNNGDSIQVLVVPTVYNVDSAVAVTDIPNIVNKSDAVDRPDGHLLMRLGTGGGSALRSSSPAMQRTPAEMAFDQVTCENNGRRLYVAPNVYIPHDRSSCAIIADSNYVSRVNVPIH